MTTAEKQLIAYRLNDYCTKVGSQNKAARILNGVSSATISQILNGNWDLITDEMFRKVSNQIDEVVEVAQTRGLKFFTNLATDAQNNALVIGILGNAGSGKTEAVKSYLKDAKNVFHVKCADYWNKRFFLHELARLTGTTLTSGSIPEITNDVINHIKTLEKPVIFLDEIDKLNDSILYTLISLYNELFGSCAIVASGSMYFEKYMLKGCKNDKKGFREIYSRFGCKFFYMPVPNFDDVVEICHLRGITDEDIITDIFNKSDNDLRRVDRLIHATIMKTQKTENLN